MPYEYVPAQYDHRGRLVAQAYERYVPTPPPQDEQYGQQQYSQQQYGGGQGGYNAYEPANRNSSTSYSAAQHSQAYQHGHPGDEAVSPLSPQGHGSYYGGVAPPPPRGEEDHYANQPHDWASGQHYAEPYNPGFTQAQGGGGESSAQGAQGSRSHWGQNHQAEGGRTETTDERQERWDNARAVARIRQQDRDLEDPHRHESKDKEPHRRRKDRDGGR